MYGPVLPVPELVSADTPSLVGTEGRSKMSKSLGNVISSSEVRPSARGEPPFQQADAARRQHMRQRVTPEGGHRWAEAY